VNVPVTLQWTLGITIAVYIGVMYGIAYVARKRVSTAEDYVVAGRRLPFSLAWMTLVATWFGAGTLLLTTDEVRREGLSAIALDPLGPSLCLIVAGLFVAGPMWSLQLLTLPDFFRRKFGPAAELLSGLIMVPSYFGWIAAEYTALAEILQLYFGLDLRIGLVLVALVGGGYTIMGGMWSVTLTDAVQLALILIGVVILAFAVLGQLGGGDWTTGLAALHEKVHPDRRVWMPTHDVRELLGWLAILTSASLGNLAAQDLLQRVFASRSARVAKSSCIFAGLMYLVFGMIPVGLGLAAPLLAPDSESGVLPILATAFLSPPIAVVFVVAVFSAVLSTIESAIIAPSSVLAQNLLGPRLGVNPLLLNRLSTAAVTIGSLLVAYAGDSARDLLESAYSATLVGLFVPMMIGLYTTPRSQAPGLAAIVVGTGVWLVHLVCGWEHFLEFLPAMAPLQLPVALVSTALSLAAYLLIEPPWRMQKLAQRT
jgi:Na+/proline symporter